MPPPRVSETAGSEGTATGSLLHEIDRTVTVMAHPPVHSGTGGSAPATGT